MTEGEWVEKYEDPRLEVPPGRFDLTEEEIANLPVLDLEEFLKEHPE